MKLGETVGTLLLVIVFVGIAMLLNNAAKRDGQLEAVADCVVEQAKAAHYAGNAYSEEAWNLFAGNCK